MKHFSSKTGFAERRKSDAGFTLLETVIYIALLSIIISAVLGSVYQIIEGSDKINSKINTEAEAHFLLRKIEWALTGISAVNLPVLASTGTTLSVNKVDFSGNPLIFDFNSGNVRLSRGGAAPIILNSGNVTIGDVQFHHVASSGFSPEAVGVSFKVNGNPYSTRIYSRK